MMKSHKTGLFAVLMAIAMGMGGELHYRFPALGTIAMLDFVSYGVALPILLSNWSRMGKFMRRSLMWAFAWTGAAMLANLFNFHTPKYWLKCVSLAGSSWAIMAVAYYVLRTDAKLYMWYLVGAGIGGWIALYYFRNGALEGFAVGAGNELGTVGSSIENLLDKQIYPIIARGILLGCVLPVFLIIRKVPVILVVGATLLGGVWLLIHGGSRSSFGMFCASAAFGFAVAYARAILRYVTKSRVRLVCAGALACGVIFGAYKFMALSGSMGEGEADKYEAQFGEGSGSSFVSGRAGFDYAFRFAFETCGIGRGEHLWCHSAMANALACEGFTGFFFWVYFSFQVLWFVCRRMPYTGRNSTFIMIMIATALWDMLGSPFGTRHKFFVLMVFIALCRDSNLYGLGTLFNMKMFKPKRNCQMMPPYPMMPPRPMMPSNRMMACR